MKNFTLDIGSDGVAVAHFDVPGRSMNTITFEVQDDLCELADILRTDERIGGLVILSRKPSGFCAGADLIEMEGAIDRWRKARSQDELRKGVESAGQYSSRLRAFETAGKPIAVIVNGVALGGGLELALAGHHRIATGDASRLRLGLPEATIGLMPGAGGTQRIPRLMGLDQSMPHLIEGRPIELDAALRSGIIHQHIAEPDSALEAAKSWVLGNREAVQPWDVKGYRFSGGPHTPAGYAKFPIFIAKAVGDGPGDHAARANILRAVYEGAMVPIDAGLRIESRYFFNTVRASSSAAMVRTLFLERQALARAEAGDAGSYGARLKSAWVANIDSLTTQSHPRRFVLGVARSLSSKMTPPENGDGFVDVHPSDDHIIRMITDHLLRSTALEASKCLNEGVVLSRGEADVRALEAGYPVQTGGPISFLEAGRSQTP